MSSPPGTGRVVLALDKLAEHWTGLKRFSLDLASALGRAAPDGLDLVYLTPIREWSTVAGLGARRRPLWPVYRRRFRRPATAVRSLLGDWRSRSVVWHALAQDAKYLPLDPRIPVVLTIHDMTDTRLLTGELLARKMGLYQANVDRASVIVAGSKFAATEIREHLQVGQRPIEVIPHGLTIDPTASSEAPPGIDDAPFLVALGRVVAPKNLHSLIAMMARLPDYRLFIVGDDRDPHAGELRQAITEAKLADRVRVLGSVSDAERLWLLQRARALVHPSLFEGFGLPVVEAMACGTPVFLARRTSLPEVGGPLAFYWDSFDPTAMADVFHRGMAAVVADSSYPEQLAAHAASFSWAAAAQAHCDIYRALLAAPPVTR